MWRVYNGRYITNNNNKIRFFLFALHFVDNNQHVRFAFQFSIRCYCFEYIRTITSMKRSAQCWEYNLFVTLTLISPAINVRSHLISRIHKICSYQIKSETNALQTIMSIVYEAILLVV